MKRVDGVVCGHIHSADQLQIGDIFYYNDGDWVESCTALVEQSDGGMKILHWAEEIAGALCRSNSRSPKLFRLVA